MPAARTADPRIVAAGDCTARRLADGSLLRLESVQSATEGGKAAAAALLGLGQALHRDAMVLVRSARPQAADGRARGAGAIAPCCAATTDAPAFSVWHYAGERLVGVDTIDASKDHLLARKLLDAGLGPTPAQAADLSFDPATLLAR